MNRLRKFLESIVFAGMRPTEDPLYLSNRTIRQKIKLGVLIGLPLVVVGALLLYALNEHKNPRQAPAAQLTPEQIAQKMLPNLNGDLKVDSNRNLEVMDVHVQQGKPLRLTGEVRNKTSHAIQNAQIVFDLTDKLGSRLGAVSTTVARIEANASARFDFPIPQPNAAFALVREVDTP